MVTQRGGNVSVVAVEGNFDHAQSGVKKLLQTTLLRENLSRQATVFPVPIPSTQAGSCRK